MNALPISSSSPDIQRANCDTSHCGTGFQPVICGTGFQPVATPGPAIPPAESTNKTLATNPNGDPIKTNDRDAHTQAGESTGDACAGLVERLGYTSCGDFVVQSIVRHGPMADWYELTYSFKRAMVSSGGSRRSALYVTRHERDR
jgi:hypothetical protein